MNLKKRDIFVLYVVVGLFCLWIVVKFIFGPFHTKLTNLGREVILQEARLKKGIALIEHKENIDKEYGKYASYFSLWGVSDEEAVASFLEEIVTLSKNSGLTILDMKPQKDAKSDKFSKQYPINIKAEADMEQLVRFLYSLQHSSLLFSVEKMVLSPKSEESSELNINMALEGVSFI